MVHAPLQRYEATRYPGVAFHCVVRIADALGVRVRERLALPPGTKHGESQM